MLYLETKTFAETNLCAPQQNFLNKHKTRKKKSSNISLVLTLQGNKMNYTNILQANNTLRSKKKTKLSPFIRRLNKEECTVATYSMYSCISASNNSISRHIVWETQWLIIIPFLQANKLIYCKHIAHQRCTQYVESIYSNYSYLES